MVSNSLYVVRTEAAPLSSTSLLKRLLPKRRSEAQILEEFSVVSSYFVLEDEGNDTNFPATLFNDVSMKTLLYSQRGTLIVFKHGIGFFCQVAVGHLLIHSSILSFFLSFFPFFLSFFSLVAG
jgi:hypothetical protein